MRGTTPPVPLARTWHHATRGLGLARRAVSALTLSALLAALLSACSGGPFADSCQGREASDFPALEDVANATLEEFDPEVRRYSGCEDTGEPDPSVIVDMQMWPDRAVANGFFTSLGWEKQDGVIFTSPDGEYRAQVVMTGEERSSRYVTLYFMHA